MDKVENFQAVLDSDDEMDDIMTEFAKEENGDDIVELSDESSADEMDSLLDEFANNQSDSDTDERKNDTKVVLSSDDDNEIENLLEEFREENASDNLLPVKEKNKNKSVVFDTDSRNGIIFNNTFEIFSEDSGEKSSDENICKSTEKESPCFSSLKLPEFKICNMNLNLKQEPEYDITKHNSESVLLNKITISSSESCIKLPCKMEPNIDNSEENVLQDELNSKSEINSESKICEKEVSLNNNASLCNNSEIPLNSPIDKTNYDNLCEKNDTELPQETVSSLNIKISCVSSVLNSEDNAVSEDSKQNNLVHSLEDNSTNASHLSAFENKADESILNQIENVVHGLEDRIPNAVLESESLTVDNFYLCKTNEEINTKCQKNLNTNEVSYNGVPIFGEEGSSKGCTVMRNGFNKYMDSKKTENGQMHSESQMPFLSPFNFSDHQTSNNFSGKGDILEVQETNYCPTSVASTSSVTRRVTKRTLESSESSTIRNDYLEYKKTKLPTDHLTKYFQSVEETVRTFPMQMQLEAKKRISELMSELEYKSFFLTNRNGPPTLYHYSQQPHPFHHPNSHLHKSCEIYSYSGMKYSTPSNSMQTFLSSSSHPFFPSIATE